MGLFNWTKVVFKKNDLCKGLIIVICAMHCFKFDIYVAIHKLLLYTDCCYTQIVVLYEIGKSISYYLL